MYLQQPDNARTTDLRSAVRQWTSRQPSWYLREATVDTGCAQWGVFLPPSRQATAGEIAIEIVNDPQLRQALAFLESPPGQAVEKAVAGLWLSPWQAALLTAALTEAWKIVLDQNRPWWQRFDVLIGTLASIVFIGLLITVSRDSR